MATNYAVITRGTTPTVKCIVTDADGTAINLAGYTCFFSIGRIKNPQLTVSNEQMEIDGNMVLVTLTQEQTLALKTGDTYMQLRAIDGDTAIATDTKPIHVADIIHNGVITDVTQ